MELLLTQHPAWILLDLWLEPSLGTAKFVAVASVGDEIVVQTVKQDEQLEVVGRGVESASSPAGTSMDQLSTAIGLLKRAENHH